MNKTYSTSKIPGQGYAVSAPNLNSPSRKRNGQCRREHTAQNKNLLVDPQYM